MTTASHKRMLVHWVNSLPLTTCLLVEELKDLRFGDVLLDIVTWLQHADSLPSVNLLIPEAAFTYDAVMERLRTVVQFVALEGCSDDEDALYLVNQADCATRVMNGENEAICAVLSILKRLARSRLQSDASTAVNLLPKHLELQEELAACSFSTREVAMDRNVSQRSEKSKAKIVGLSSNKFRRVHPVKKATLSSKLAPKLPLETKIPAESSEKKQENHQKCAIQRAKMCSRINRKQSKVRAKEEPKQQHPSHIFQDASGLHVFNMIDPTVRPARTSRSADQNPNEECEIALRVCEWMETLGVKVPRDQVFMKRLHGCATATLSSEKKIREIFSDGVLLCQLSTAIAQKYKMKKRGQCTTGLLSAGTYLFPQNAYQRRQNLARVVEMLNDIGITGGAALVVCLRSKPALKAVNKPGQKGTSPALSIWRCLEQIRIEVQQIVATYSANQEFLDMKCINEEPILNPTAETIGNDEITATAVVETALVGTEEKSIRLTKKKAPYITKEQMSAVNHWLASVGLEVRERKNVGVLQDLLRNGVLLCDLSCRMLNSTPFSYYKMPKTLMEVRQNLTLAIGYLSRLVHARLPAHYYKPSIIDAIMLGDRQVTYGLLWHLWQYTQNQISTHSNLEKSFISPDMANQMRPSSTAGARQKPTNGEIPFPSQPNPILLDVPAAVLAEEEVRRKPREKNHHQSCRIPAILSAVQHIHVNVSWDASEFEEEDDLVPAQHWQPAGMTSEETKEENSAAEQAKHANTRAASPDELSSPPSSPLSKKNMSPAIESYVRDTTEDPVGASGSAPHVDVSSIILQTTRPTNHSSFTFEKQTERVVAHVEAHSSKDAEQISREEVDEILQWLKWLNVRLKDPSAFHDPASRLLEFQSGVLLCCIVEKVEYMRSIDGICRKEKLAKANALHNITKALTILQQKKTMPPHLLRQKNDIYKGSRLIILRLLQQIRKAYGHRNYNRRTPKVHPNRTADVGTDTSPPAKGNITPDQLQSGPRQDQIQHSETKTQIPK